MPYVDYTFYRDTFQGRAADEAAFLECEIRACETIDNKTMYQVAQRGLSYYSAFAQDLIKKAVCAQIDYIVANGGVDSIDEQTGGSVSLGKFSYNTPNASQSTQTLSNTLCSSSINFLAPTGLLYRGIDNESYS